jgi:hypothetical protein
MKQAVAQLPPCAANLSKRNRQAAGAESELDVGTMERVAMVRRLCQARLTGTAGLMRREKEFKPFSWYAPLLLRK